MKKCQTFMLLIAIWLAIIIPACRQRIQVTAWEENPVIVDQPRSDKTVFTDWEEIKLTYTVRWLDGYGPLFDEAKPENMSFAPFELDPVRGYKLELQNRRKYKKENYVDLIYHLKHIGENKGDVPISEQTFRYRKEEAGKSKGGLEVYDVKAPGIMLRYDSVLTKDANDIIDRMDFGSVKGQENLWNGLISGLALFTSAILFLLFRKPAVYAKKTNKTKVISAGQAIDKQEERFTPKYALILLSNQLFQLRAGLANSQDNQKSYETRAVICNELRRFFLSYVPDLKNGEFTYEDIRNKILQMPEKRKRELLAVLINWLEDYEKILYLEETRNCLIDKITPIKMDEILTIRKCVNDLDDWKIWLFNKHQGWQRLNKQLKELFRRDR